MKQRFTAPVAVHLFLVRDEEILLLRRFNTGYEDGKYSVPAGHLDGGEEVVKAAVREAREEIGVEIDPADVRVIGVMHRHAGVEERIDFFVEVRRWAGEITNREPEKCDELRWVRMDDLPENVIPYVRKAIGNFRTGVWFDSFGFRKATPPNRSGVIVDRSGDDLQKPEQERTVHHGDPILLSLKEEYFEAIKSGKKRYEYRKRYVDRPSVAYVYCTAPAKAIMGIVRFGAPVSGPPEVICAISERESGEGKLTAEYLKGKEKGYAIPVLSWEEIEPLTLEAIREKIPDFVPPRSYCRLDNKSDLLQYLESVRCSKSS